jgi:lipid-A-disaccharide synthase
MMKKLSPITFFIVAGEPSGDAHGASLMRAIKKEQPESRFVGHGGDRMTKEGLERMYHTNQLGIVGFSEVIKHLPFMLTAMNRSLERLKELRPNRIILIDYPGFNLRLAKKSAELMVPITYFILPQLWAWKEKRIKVFHRHIDQSLSIFPFEKNWFEARSVITNFVGHPFSDIIGPETNKTQFLSKHGLSKSDNILTLLPGSRQQEIDRHWPTYCRTVEILRAETPELKVVVGKANGVTIPNVIDNLLYEEHDVRAAMAHGTAALTASGTATLECAVLDTPEVVCYKLSFLSGKIAKKINRSPFISMTNLIAGRKIVPEFLQQQANAKNLSMALKPLLKYKNERQKMRDGFEEVRRLLGLPGAYDRAAKLILKRTIYG